MSLKNLTIEDESKRQVAMYAADAGIGLEDVSPDELLVPFLRILQALSPQCDEATGGAAFNSAARPGMLINSALGELYDGKRGLLFIPVLREHKYVEYIPREAGAGFVGVWEPSDPRIPDLIAAQGRFGKLKLESGTELVDTYSLYGLIALPPESPTRTANGSLLLPEAEVGKVVIGFSSTQIKAHKTIITKLTDLRGEPPIYPIWAFAWHLRTVGQKNKKGSYYGWQPGLWLASRSAALLDAEDPLYVRARAFNTALRAGLARADFATSREHGDEVGDDEVPF